MSAHTPGPWLFDEENTGRDYNIGYGIYTNESGRTLAHIPLREADGIAEANARLIAAAPELLEASRTAQCACSVKERDSGHLVDCWMPALLAAIAKAEGR